jgi:hypothetical protein
VRRPCAARPGAEAGWWWDAAIGLLDALCEVGAEARAGAPGSWPAHLARLEASLGLDPGAGEVRPAALPARSA